MYKLSTAPWRFATVLARHLWLPWPVRPRPAVRRRCRGQAASNPDWRHIGNISSRSGIGRSGHRVPVKRVWYGSGRHDFVQTASAGRVLSDGGSGELAGEQCAGASRRSDIVVRSLPEPARRPALARQTGRVYAFGEYVYRSDDGGAHWENVTSYRGDSIIGGGLADLAIAPGNSDEIVTAGAAGVFRSVDGGRSWSGLNEGLAQSCRRPGCWIFRWAIKACASR